MIWEQISPFWVKNFFSPLFFSVVLIFAFLLFPQIILTEDDELLFGRHGTDSWDEFAALQQNAGVCSPYTHFFFSFLVSFFVLLDHYHRWAALQFPACSEVCGICGIIIYISLYYNPITEGWSLSGLWNLVEVNNQIKPQTQQKLQFMSCKADNPPTPLELEGGLICGEIYLSLSVKRTPHFVPVVIIGTMRFRLFIRRCVKGRLE